MFFLDFAQEFPCTAQTAERNMASVNAPLNPSESLMQLQFRQPLMSTSQLQDLSSMPQNLIATTEMIPALPRYNDVNDADDRLPSFVLRQSLASLSSFRRWSWLK